MMSKEVSNDLSNIPIDSFLYKNGKLLKLQDNPPKGNVGMIWGILTNAVGMQIGRLIADLFE